MNELYQGRLGAGVPTTGLPLPPIQIQPPSMGSVLDMLNVINGILFVQIRFVFLLKALTVESMLLNFQTSSVRKISKLFAKKLNDAK